MNEVEKVVERWRKVKQVPQWTHAMVDAVLDLADETADLLEAQAKEIQQFTMALEMHHDTETVGQFRKYLANLDAKADDGEG